jgi:hypothetical protein
MNPRVESVEPNRDHTLTIVFTNGETRRFDVKPYLDKGIFQELQDLGYFGTVRPFLGSIQWPHGQDFCPDTLYEEGLPVPVEPTQPIKRIPGLVSNQLAQKTAQSLQSESEAEPRPNYTKKQGQYLAFIYHYTKVHKRPPAETDMQAYFGVTAPSVHQMVVRLEQKALIKRVPWQARTIEVLVPPEHLPPLQ